MGARPSSYKAKVGVADVITAARQWSDQQLAIFDWFSGKWHCQCPWKPCKQHTTPTSNLVVRARAGVGKTTVVIEGVNRAPEELILVCAFNKRIADTLTGMITNEAARAMTLHSLGYRAIRDAWGYIPVASGTVRGDWLTSQIVDKDTPKPIQRIITLLHTKARDMMPLMPTTDTLTQLALDFDYVPDEGWSKYPLEWVVEQAIDVMSFAAVNEPDAKVGIDFADMIYLPLVHNLLKPDYDLVVVDEAQDLTVAQLTMAQRVCKGRICVVGDDRQAIYAFRGADTGSLDRLKAELNAQELPLTVTYRCGQSIVRRAQKLVPDIQAAPSNPEGIDDEIDLQDLFTQAVPGDFIISRINAPLVKITLAFLRQRKRATMLGRDIGVQILAIMRRFNNCPDITTLLAQLDNWERKTVTRLASYGQYQLVDRCHDQADMIREIAFDSMGKYPTSDRNAMADMLQTCNTLFIEDKSQAMITCSSIHKAKGLEADRVFILRESLYRRGWSLDEANCDYVATTRAKRHHTYVTGVL